MEVVWHLVYAPRAPGGAVNSVGFYRVNGEQRPEWCFTRPPERQPEEESCVTLRVPNRPGGMATFEMIFPYGDAVEIAGVEIEDGAAWECSARPQRPRWLAFGDSVTQGFTASDVLHTYPFLIGEARGWEVLNAAVAGRGTRAEDGPFLAEISADLITVALGVNDWQGGIALEAFQTQLRGLWEGLTRNSSVRKFVAITPLWVSANWVPPNAKYPLESYRDIIRNLSAEIGLKRLQVIEGPSLIDPAERLFDEIQVHPNDAGFAQMADRLSAALGEIY